MKTRVPDSMGDKRSSHETKEEKRKIVVVELLNKLKINLIIYTSKYICLGHISSFFFFETTH